jgi:hypothetical protein
MVWQEYSKVNCGAGEGAAGGEKEQSLGEPSDADESR